MSANEKKSRIQAALERRSSNAAGTHGDRRLKRLKTRASKKDRALKEWE